MQDPEFKVLAPRGPVTRRQAIGVGGVGLASLLLAACGGKSGASAGSKAATTTESIGTKVEGGPLLMANWADYVDPAHYKSYQAKFGPKVQVEGYGSNDELIAKLSAGGSAYDVVVPSGGYVPEIVQKGLARPLDHSLLPNLKNLEPKFTKNAWDPGNKHAVTKDFGVTSFYYRKDVVPEPPDTLLGWWQLLPKLKGKTINLIEGSGETLPLALLALDLDASSTKDADYKQAMKLMSAAKPAITNINSTYIERLGKGDIDVGIGWNGDVARAAADAKKKGIEIGFFVPQDRGWYWTDEWLIPAAGKNPVAAHAWINYVLDPKIAGGEQSYMGYNVPITGALDFVPKAVAANPITAIPDSVMANYSSGINTPELTAIQSKYYSLFRS
jgi:spermidine/putrescine transport system substrate-binding protein